MEEAEALSTKIGIMVNGELKCLGSVQHIKNKFGHGYEIEIKIKKPDVQMMQQTLKDYQIKGYQLIFIINCKKNKTYLHCKNVRAFSQVLEGKTSQDR